MMIKAKNKDEHMQSIIDSINESEGTVKQLLESDGCAILRIYIKNVSKEEFEQWEVGGAIGDGVQQLLLNCNHATLVVLHNNLKHILNELEEQNPMLEIADTFSQLKGHLAERLTIDEEDLNKDDES